MSVLPPHSRPETVRHTWKQLRSQHVLTPFHNCGGQTQSLPKECVLRGKMLGLRGRFLPLRLGAQALHVLKYMRCRTSRGKGLVAKGLMA